MKKTLIALLFSGLCAAPVQAKTDLNDLGKELEIMTSILQTAMKQSNNRKGIRFRSIDATYLASQGVVFNVRTSNGGWAFAMDLSGMTTVVPPAPPLEPLTVFSGGNGIRIELDDHELQMITEDALRVAQDALRESSEQLRELRSRERELAWEQREYERRRRDIEFERRNADSDYRKELDKELKELDQELKSLETKKKEVDEYADQLEQEQQQQAQKREQAMEQEYKRFLADFEAEVGDILCSYGAGLKALPEDEHVTFLLSDFGSVSHKGNQDRVYVFSLKDIRACVVDKIDAEKLLGNAKSYLF